MKLDILAFGAHPDDVELGCGGTVAKEIQLGKKVGIVDLTRGELGTRGTAETRDAESTAASKILGTSIRVNLEFADGFFINDRNHQLEIIKILRKYQPEIVLCNAITDRHIDHGKGSSLVSHACFLSGLLKVETKFDDDDEVWQKPWRPKQVYHYIQWQPIEPDFVVDISLAMPKKIAAVMAYKTQFYNPRNSDPETPISNKNFIDSVTYRAQDLGRLTGVAYAEGFTVERYPVINSLFDLK